MKIYENNFTVDSYRFLFTTNILRTLVELETKNIKLLIITPRTKLKDLFFLKKGSLGENLLMHFDNDFKQTAISNKYLINLTEKINQKYQFNLVEPNLDYDRVVKILFEFSDELITQKQLPTILTLINQFTNAMQDVVVAGFSLDYYDYDKLNILHVITKIPGNINFHNLPLLCLMDENNFIEIEDVEALVAWLEVKTKTVLTIKDLQSYFQNQKNFNSFLIERVFLELL